MQQQLSFETRLRLRALHALNHNTAMIGRFTDVMQLTQWACGYRAASPEGLQQMALHFGILSPPIAKEKAA
jgi:hypothetical protein